MGCCHDHDHSYYSTGLSYEEKQAIEEGKEAARQLAHLMKTLGIDPLPKPPRKPVRTAMDVAKDFYSEMYVNLAMSAKKDK